MAETIEPAESTVDVEEEADEAEPTPSEPTNDIESLKSRLQKLEEKAIQSRERNRLLRQELAKLRNQSAPKQEAEKKSDDFGLLEKSFLRSAGITAEDEVELARTTAKKWDMPIDKLVDDEDFKTKLEKMRTQKANELATSNIKGSGGKGQAKETLEYWVAKGTPPSREDVPDRKLRAQIARSMMANAKSSKTFYND